MSRQRQLNALLFELQAAPTALERARILARAWRSVRDLSTGDRRLLARYAAFEGAEQLLENLAGGRRGTAPAALLRVLSSADADDGGTVARLVAGLRGGAPLSGLAVEAVDAAAELVAEQAPQPHGRVPVGRAPAAGAREVEAGEATAVTAAMAALSEVGKLATAAAAGRTAGEGSGRSEASVPGAEAEGLETASPSRGAPGAQVGELPKAALMPGWDELARAAVPAVSVLAEAGNERNASDQAAGVGAASLPEEPASVLERFGKLRSELGSRSPMSEPRGLALSFPDGWQRRRAVSRLLECEAARSLDGGLELVRTLGRERDRRWCLGLLLDRYPVSPAVLAELLEEVASPIARRRFSARARFG